MGDGTIEETPTDRERRLNAGICVSAAKFTVKRRALRQSKNKKGHPAYRPATEKETPALAIP